MSQPQITVVDANKVNQTIFTTNPNGQATSANSQPVVISNDQTPLPIADGTDGTGITQPTGGTGIRGWLSGIYQKLSNSITVTGPLTDTQLRNSAVSVTGPLTDTQIRANPISVSGPLTDTQLRANAIATYHIMGNPVNRSGSITVGGTSQQLAAANANRKGLIIYNLSVGDLWVNIFGETAILSQPSLLIPAGVYQEFPIGAIGYSAVNIIGATTAQAFYAQEY